MVFSDFNSQGSLQAQAPGQNVLASAFSVIDRYPCLNNNGFNLYIKDRINN